MKIKLTRTVAIMILLLVVVASIIPAMIPAQAQESNCNITNSHEIDKRTQTMFKEKTLTPTLTKVDSRILQASMAIQELRIEKEPVEQHNLNDFSNSLLKVNEAGGIQVDLAINKPGTQQINLLTEMGMKIEIVLKEYDIVEGWLPYDQIEAVANLDFVKRIRTPGYPIRRTGSVNSAGDGVLRADDARSEFGVDGSGFEIGVISDGVDHLSASVATGDLPSTVQVIKNDEGDEGTAMLEIIHDLAPGADLAFYGPETSADMVAGIQALAAAGCDIIVDDLGWIDDRKFEDGPIAQEARQFCQDGGVYVSACGNSAEEHYSHQYVRMTGPGGDYPYAHAYGSGDMENRFTVPNGAEIVCILQWNNEWGQAGDDFAFALWRVSNWELLKLSDAYQEGDGDPWEGFSWYNDTGNSVTVSLEIYEYDLCSAPSSLVLDYHVRYLTSTMEHFTPQDSIIGHPAVEEVLSTAATDAATPGTIEDFSSRGPATIYFPTYEERKVPNITGTDGVQTKTGKLGYFSNPFYGTSAAAPHIAALAALVWEADPTLTASEVHNALTSNAIDLGSSGWDGAWGFGRADAHAAVEAVFPVTQYTLTMGKSGNGTVTPAIGDHTYDEGEVINLSANPATDWHFVNWTGDTDTIANVNDPTTTITMNGDYSISANFELDQPVSLISHWPFDEINGGITPDIVGGNDGTVYGASLTPGSSGGNALQLDGNDDYVTTGLDLNAAEGSIILWIKTPGEADGGSAYDGIIGDRTVVPELDYEIQVAITGDDLISYMVNDGRTGQFSDTVFNDNILHHLAVTWGQDGSYLYVDGNEEYSDTTPVTIPENNNPVHMGRYYGDGNYTNRYFNGVLDEVRVYNYALSDAEVLTLYEEFAPETHTLTTSSSDGGFVETPGEGIYPYDHGAVVNIVATADTGYHFVNWTGDTSTIADVNDPITTITMNGDYSIIANFEEDVQQYTLTMNKVGNGSLTPSVGNHTYNEGTVVDISATPAVNWYFNNWTGDTEDIANADSPNTTITMNDDYSIVANFFLNDDCYQSMVTAGLFHTVGLKSDGNLIATGWNLNDECEVSSWMDIRQINAGQEHTVGIKSDGTVVATGKNSSGQCNVDGWAGISQISAGGGHTVGLTNGGTVIAIGNNAVGQCDIEGWVDIQQVATGKYHTVGLKTDGSVVAQGMNLNNQCEVSGWVDIQQVAAGGNHTLGLKGDKNVIATGDNSFDQCNIGNWVDIQQIAAGGGHSVGLKTDGTVVAKGNNTFGQCNVGGWMDIQQVAAGEYHTVGLKTDGTVVAAGKNDHHECDVGSWDMGACEDAWDPLDYDKNKNGKIEYGEMVDALMDYLTSGISYSQMIDVLMCYLTS